MKILYGLVSREILPNIELTSSVKGIQYNGILIPAATSFNMNAFAAN